MSNLQLALLMIFLGVLIFAIAHFLELWKIKKNAQKIGTGARVQDDYFKGNIIIAVYGSRLFSLFSLILTVFICVLFFFSQPVAKAVNTYINSNQAFILAEFGDYLPSQDGIYVPYQGRVELVDFEPRQKTNWDRFVNRIYGDEGLINRSALSSWNNYRFYMQRLKMKTVNEADWKLKIAFIYDSLATIYGSQAQKNKLCAKVSQKIESSLKWILFQERYKNVPAFEIAYIQIIPPADISQRQLFSRVVPDTNLGLPRVIPDTHHFRYQINIGLKHPRPHQFLPLLRFAKDDVERFGNELKARENDQQQELNLIQSQRQMKDK